MSYPHESFTWVFHMIHSYESSIGNIVTVKYLQALVTKNTIRSFEMLTWGRVRSREVMWGHICILIDAVVKILGKRHNIFVLLAPFFIPDKWTVSILSFGIESWDFSALNFIRQYRSREVKWGDLRSLKLNKVWWSHMKQSDVI